MATSSQRAIARIAATEAIATQRDALKRLTEKHDIIPHRSMLVDMLMHAPDIDWRRLAKRDPFKFIQCLEKLSVMSGYVFDGMSNGPTVVVVEGMSDHALVAALAAARAKTLSLPLTIDQSPAPDPALGSESDIYKVARTVPASGPDSEATIVPAPTSSDQTLVREAGGTGSETE